MGPLVSLSLVGAQGGKAQTAGPVSRGRLNERGRWTLNDLASEVSVLSVVLCWPRHMLVQEEGF